jgi:hypothetical protein
MRRSGLVIYVTFALSALNFSSSSLAEDCQAPDAWFKGSGTPVPSNSEPKRGVDCEFYQRAWQQFLYVTDKVANSPRFLKAPYKTYSDLFGTDKPAGLLAGKTTELILAPRTIEHASTTDAEDIFQAGSNGILIDQNGHPIFYNIIVNPDFTRFIEKNKLNDPSRKSLRNFSAKSELPVGVVEYKAAWQIIDSIADSNHRITAEASVPWLKSDGNGKLLVDSSKPLRTVTVALIGLHVVFRPENHPELVWSTFEYDRNAPSLKGNPDPKNFATNCVNSAEPVDETVADDGNPYLLYAHGIPFKDANKRPKALNVVDPANQIFSPANNIVRAFPFSACFPGFNVKNAVNSIDPAITSLNANVLSKLKNDDRHVYSLVGATWLDEPNNPNGGLNFTEDEIFDDFQLGGEDRLSSTSMESMTQIGSPNCFSCHDTTDKGLSQLGFHALRINVSHIFRRFMIQK